VGGGNSHLRALYIFFVLQQPLWARASSLSRRYDHTQTPHSVGLLFMSDQPDSHSSHKRQTSMHP